MSEIIFLTFNKNFVSLSVKIFVAAGPLQEFALINAYAQTAAKTKKDR
jgi:hypothetical protein